MARRCTQRLAYRSPLATILYPRPFGCRSGLTPVLMPTRAHCDGFWHTAEDNESRKIQNRRTVADAGGRAKLSLPDTEILKQAIHATFARCQIHAEPVDIEPPPEAWRAAFAQLAAEVGLRAKTLDAAYTEVETFWKLLVA